jgi:hypothetical protein
MKRDYKNASTVPVSLLPSTRGYQQELLDESLKRNIIIALDTGSGKTLIAVLRMKTEVMEREPKKVRFAPERYLFPGISTICSFIAIMVCCSYSRPRRTTKRGHRNIHSCISWHGFRLIGA